MWVNAPYAAAAAYDDGGDVKTVSHICAHVKTWNYREWTELLTDEFEMHVT